MNSAMANEFSVALDPVMFATDLGFTPDPWQERVLRWDGKRIILCCSRQSGKSTIAAILGLHRALNYERSSILLISPSQRQSSELFRKVTDLIGKLSIRPRLLEDNRLSCTFSNQSRIISLPSSETTIRGFSNISLIIEDEASRVDDNLHKSIRPMLAISRGKLILLSTPFGKRGHFFDEWSTGTGWNKVKVTAEECPRISPEFLEEERRTIGDWWFRQEYECEFVEREDSVFTYDWIRKIMDPNLKPLIEDWGA